MVDVELVFGNTKMMPYDVLYLISGPNTHGAFFCDGHRVGSQELALLLHLLRSALHLECQARAETWIFGVVQRIASFFSDKTPMTRLPSAVSAH
jgi:hypothetical protein